jgi:hypothetical protein
MALEMKSVCEKCESGLASDDEAYICVYECTFCPLVRRRWPTSAQTAVASWCAARAQSSRTRVDVRS